MKTILAFGAILAVFAFLERDRIFPWPYYYDEADYMFAASLGWRANWTDEPTRSLAGFVRAGLRDGADSSRRAALSAGSRAGSDVDFYRHWHGPLYFYWLHAVTAFQLDEPSVRGWSYIFPALTALLIYFGTLWLLPAPERNLAAVLSTVFYLWSYTTVFTNEIAPHQLFALCAIASLLLLMKWRAAADKRCWYGAILAAAGAFCTLEVAFVLLLVITVFSDKRRLINGVFLFLGAVLLIWPAGLIKLSFLKAYLFMSYLALFRKSAWGGAGFFEIWRPRLAGSPVGWVLLAIAAILYFRFCDSATRRSLAPVVLYGFLTFLVLLRVVSETPRYMLPFLPAFQLAAGLIFASILKNWKPPARFAASAAICLAVFCNTYSQLRAHPIRPAPRLSGLLTRLRVEKLDGKKLLAPQNDVPMIHYYFPAIILSGYVSASERSTLAAHSGFDAVLDSGFPVNLQRQSPAPAHYISQR